MGDGGGPGGESSQEGSIGMSCGGLLFIPLLPVCFLSLGGALEVAGSIPLIKDW